MSNLTTQGQIKSVTFSGTVIRCGCSDTQKTKHDWHGKENRPCPNPRQVKDLGVLSYRSTNPVKNLAWRIVKWVKSLNNHSE